MGERVVDRETDNSSKAFFFFFAKSKSRETEPKLEREGKPRVIVFTVREERACLCNRMTPKEKEFSRLV